ncbi:MAG: hypothetical protein WBL93_10915 [Lutisporaceae bacterium]
MDKELKKSIKKLLWLDTMFISKDSLWNILDEIEDELEDIFKQGEKNDTSLENFFKLKNK